MNKIKGQTSIFLLDLKGKEYPAIAEVNRKKRVNGQREISLSFLYDEINADFIHDIEFGWKILFKGEWYTITFPAYALDGNKFSVGVDAVLSFFVDMNGHYLQDEAEDKSNTPATYFRELFQDTGYNFVLVDNLKANTLNYQANQSKTERFLYGIDRFKGEYVIRGKQAYVHDQIGSDKDVILHEDLNIKDVSIEVDASGFHTWAKGFGDKDDSEQDSDYKLEVSYESPLIAKHGYIEGPAIRDGKYKKAAELKEAVKKQVENSYKISSSIDAVDLTNNGYPEMQFEEGDRIWLYVTDLKQNQQVRVMEIDETFDWEGNIIDAKYTLGNEGIATRYKTQQYNTLKDFSDILNGKKKIEKSWLEDAIQRASDIINGNLDSHLEYNPGEIIGINKDNPNGYMRFNTDGLGFSRDGGKSYRSAITYEGVVADAITTGTMFADRIAGGILASLNNNTFFNLNTGELNMRNANFTLGNQATITFTDRANQIIYTKENYGGNRTSGLRVSHDLDGDGLPSVYMGTSTEGSLSASGDRFFTGFLATTSRHESNTGMGNSIIGRNLRMVDLVENATKGLELSTRKNELVPFNKSVNSMNIGSREKPFSQVFINNALQANESFYIKYKHATDQSFIFKASYGGDNHLAFFGSGAGDTHYYNLGTSARRFSNIYLANEPDVTSDERLKTGIKSIDVATDIIRKLNPIEFRFKLSNTDLLHKNKGLLERGHNVKKYGFSAQQTHQALDSLGVTEQTIVNKNDDNYYSMQTTQIIPLLVKDNQDLRKELNEVKEMLK